MSTQDNLISWQTLMIADEIVFGRRNENAYLTKTVQAVENQRTKTSFYDHIKVLSQNLQIHN